MAHWYARRPRRHPGMWVALAAVLLGLTSTLLSAGPAGAADDPPSSESDWQRELQEYRLASERITSQVARLATEVLQRATSIASAMKETPPTADPVAERTAVQTRLASLEQSLERFTAEERGRVDVNDPLYSAVDTTVRAGLQQLEASAGEGQRPRWARVNSTVERLLRQAEAAGSDQHLIDLVRMEMFSRVTRRVAQPKDEILLIKAIRILGQHVGSRVPFEGTGIRAQFEQLFEQSVRRQLELRTIGVRNRERYTRLSELRPAWDEIHDPNRAFEVVREHWERQESAALAELAAGESAERHLSDPATPPDEVTPAAKLAAWARIETARYDIRTATSMRHDIEIVARFPERVAGRDLHGTPLWSVESALAHADTPRVDRFPHPLVGDQDCGG